MMLRTLLLPAVVLLIAFVGCADESDPAPHDTAQDVPADVVTDADGPDADDADAGAIGDAADTDTGISDSATQDVVADADASDAPDSTADADAEPSVGSWLQVLPPSISKEHVFKGVWLDGNGATMLAGVDGVLARGVGPDWTVLSEGEWPNFNGLWGVSPTDAWAVGLGGAIAHWNGTSWVVPGGCVTDLDCDDGSTCTVDTCDDAGSCRYAPTNEAGCCGGVAWEATFGDGGLEGWNIADLYANDPLNGGLVWSVFGHVGADEKPRYTSPPSALYFGDPTKPCIGEPATICPDFATGGIVGATARSPSIDLPQGAEGQLSFQLFVDSEGGTFFDALTLSVVANGLTNQVWAKDEIASAFVPVTVDVSQWLGQTIQLELRFDSGDSFGNEGEGVYIDDMIITTTCGATPDQGPTLPTLFDVWAAGPDEAWAVGVGGTIARWDGASWKALPPPPEDPWPIRALHGAEGELIAGGEKGLLLESHGGGGLEQATLPTGGNILAVWAASATDRWAVGASGTVLHDGGAGWSLVPAPTGVELRGVTHGGGGAVVVVGEGGAALVGVGGLFTPEDPGTVEDLNAVWTSPTGTVMAVGAAGTALRRVGGVWLKDPAPTTQALYAISGLSDEEVWAAGDSGVILRWNGTTWEDRSNPLPLDYFGIFVAAKDDVWLVGEEGALVHWDGEEYAQVQGPTGEATLYAVWGTGPKDVYAAGDGFVMRWDGTAWLLVASVRPMQNLRSVCGAAADNVVVVGAGGTILRYDGRNWAQQPIEPIVYEDGSEGQVTDQLHGCWVSSESRAFAVGENGTIVEFDGAVWKRGANQVPASLRSVFAASDSLAFAVGIEGTILRYDGAQWLPMPSGSVATLFDIHGTSLDDLTVVGDLGTILRFVPPPIKAE